ncbi:MAG: long-chain fatty acid--CoA ligase [Agarilytica sp.]
MSMSTFPVYDLIAQRATMAPDAIALEDFSSNKQISYRQLNENACQAAHVLQKLDITGGKPVSILSLNCIEFFELMFACAKNGSIFIPLNWRQTATETQPVIEDSGLDTIFYDAANQTLAQEIKSLCPHISIIPLADGIDASSDSYQKRRNASPTSFDALTRELEDIWYLLYTSGTTGKPKAVIQNFAMTMANYINTQVAIDLASSDTTINFLPLFHTGGINLYTLPTLLAGGKVIVLPKFEPDAVVDLIDQGKVSIFFGVPAIYRAIHEHPKFSTMNFSSVRSLGCGGAPIQEYVLHDFAERGVIICNGFGMTETGPMVCLMDEDSASKKIGSIGRPKLLLKVRIVDEQGNDQPAGSAGELLLAGANITPGYWRNKEATDKAFENGWLRTGDVAKMDEDGYLYIVDRIKDMYISGGENVYPAEVEAAIDEHEQILESVVVGLPDPKWGEIGCAFIRATEGFKLDQDEMKAFARARLAGYKTPQHFALVEDYPRTAAGKVKKHELRKYAAETLTSK